MLDPALARQPLRPLRAREYMRLVDAGVFGDEKLELLGGVLVQMSPQGPPHARIVAVIGERLILALKGRLLVRQHSGLQVADDSIPEPDLTVAPEGSWHAHPRRASLVIEVAQSSLDYDRDVKLGYYAAAGVPEYWIVDVRHRRVTVHTSPARGERRYRKLEVLGRGRVLRPIRLPEVAIRVSEILPPPRKRARKH